MYKDVDEINTFDLAAAEWKRHDCNSDSDVCGCTFQFNCTRCGAHLLICGESMPEMIGTGGKCEACHYEAWINLDPTDFISPEACRANNL